MLPLAGPQIPDSPDALADALRTGLSAHGLETKEVAARGPWPALESLTIDLTGAKLSREHRLPETGLTRDSGFSAARFDLLAQPGILESIPVRAAMHAQDAGFELCAGAGTESVLLLKRAAHGDVSVEVARTDLERLVHSLVCEAAGEHGVTIKSTKLRFTSRGPRAVSLVAEVVAKMFIATATVTLSGDLDLDEQLNARLSNLRFNGDGMVANLAGGFIRPYLARFEGRAFPLMSFALGEVSLRDVALEAGETLRISAKFGS
jgi:hypothetical protein